MKVVRPGRSAELAAHALGELARDRQAEAGALGVVGGEEGLEDAGHGLALDAEAGVGHREAHLPFVARG